MRKGFRVRLFYIVLKGVPSRSLQEFPQLKLLHFTRNGQWEFVDQDNTRWHLIVRNLATAPLSQLILKGVAPRNINGLCKDHKRDNLFTKSVVWCSYDRNVAYL